MRLGILAASLCVAAPALAVDPAGIAWLAGELRARPSEESLSLARTLAGPNTFTCAEVAKLVAAIAEKHRLALVEVLAPKVTDGKGCEEVVQLVPIDDAGRARKLLPKPPPPPAPKEPEGPSLVLSSAEIDVLAGHALAEPRWADAVESLRVSLAGEPRGIDVAGARRILEAFARTQPPHEPLAILEPLLLPLDVAGVVSLLEPFPPAERVRALETVRDALAEPSRAAGPVAATFAQDGARVRNVLLSAKPRSPRWGTLGAGGVVFLLDASGSMGDGSDSPFVQASEDLWQLLAQLPDGTPFNVGAFAGKTVPRASALVSLTNSELADTKRWLAQAPAGGGTNLRAALEWAFALPGVSEIFVLSDGQPNGPRGSPPEILELVRTRRAAAGPVVHATFASKFAPKATPGAAFMIELARAGGGRFRAAAPAPRGPRVRR